MPKAYSNDVERGQIRERDEDYPEQPSYKRQRSEKTILAMQLGGFHLEADGTGEEGQANGNHVSEEVTNGVDETDSAGKRLQGLVEGGLNVITGGKLVHQIGYERDDISEEQFDNNIEIRNPEHHIATGIKLGVHLSKHTNGGFIVRKILEDGLLANKDIRPGDIITHLEDTDLRNMSLAEIQNRFWNLNLDKKFTLKILRVVGDEEENDGAQTNYTEFSVQIAAIVNDDVDATTNNQVNCGKFPRPLGEDRFFISVFIRGNPRYLRAEGDETLKVVYLKSLKDSNSHWKQQFASVDGQYCRLLYNVGTGKTLLCHVGESPNVLMSPKGPLDQKSFPLLDEYNRLLIGTSVPEGSDNFYLQPASNPNYYMRLRSDSLELVTNEHLKSVFHFNVIP